MVGTHYQHEIGNSVSVSLWENLALACWPRNAICSLTKPTTAGKCACLRISSVSLCRSR